MYFLEISKIWNKIIYEVSFLLKKEPILSDFYHNNILKHNHLSYALSYILSNKLATSTVSSKKMHNLFNDIYLKNIHILHIVVQDIKAIVQRDPAVKDFCTPLLYLKGFHALEAYRISHYLWKIKKYALSSYLHSQISSKLSVDIHPAASIGTGIMLDHATGIVIGESVTIEDNVSIFHSVTLGGTGKNYTKNRHPTVRNDVTIGAGAKILGNIEVGVGAKIGAGSIVLKNVPSYVTVAGVPAKIVNKSNNLKYSCQDHNSFSCIKTFQYGDGI